MQREAETAGEWQLEADERCASCLGELGAHGKGAHDTALHQAHWGASPHPPPHWHPLGTAQPTPAATPSWLASVVECSNTNKHLGAISIYICCSFLLIPCLCGCCGDSLLAVATACVRPAMWDGQNHVRNNSQRQALLKENL